MNRLNKAKPNTFTGLLLITLAAFCSSVSAFSSDEESAVINAELNAPQAVSIKTNVSEDFMLWADYYPGDKLASGVIIVHDCESDRHAYTALAKSMAQQGLHTISVDLRGYGESVSPVFSREKAKQKAQDLVSFQSKMGLISANWSKDLLATYKLLLQKIDKSSGISIITSGCSSAYAVALAEKVHLNAMVMITPQMTYADKERYKNLIDIPSYFLTSSHHQDSYAVAHELFTWNGDKRSKILTFKGSRYDHRLIQSRKYLANDIALWLKSIK